MGYFLDKLAEEIYELQKQADEAEPGFAERVKRTAQRVTRRPRAMGRLGAKKIRSGASAVAEHIGNNKKKYIGGGVGAAGLAALGAYLKHKKKGPFAEESGE